MPYTAESIGYRERDTSRKAADDMKSRAPTIRKALREAYMARDMTADEAAAAIGRHHGSVRPRVTELANDGFLEDSGRRREGRFGKAQIVWRAVSAQAEFDLGRRRAVK